MKPSYKDLKSNHYSSNFKSQNFRDPEEVYKEIGYDLSVLIAENSAYKNTCAVRMSLALLKTRVPFQGRIKIKDGKFKGEYVEPGAKLMADQLAKIQAFGRPEVYEDSWGFKKEAFGKKGVVLFHKIDGYGGGHIDLIEPENHSYVCHSHCFFNCKEVWFWGLV